MKLEIDDELAAVAMQALANAFYAEYSSLVLKYEAAVVGLGDTSAFRYGQLNDMSNVAAIDEENNSWDMMDIEHHQCPEFGGISRPDSLAEALQMKGHAIIINNLRCFDWDDELGWVACREV